MSDQQVLKLINLAIQCENLKESNINIFGQTGQGDGYSGKIVFVTVTGKTEKGKSKTLNLAVKQSIANPVVRTIIANKQLYEKEVYIYNDVVPTFRKLQQEFGLEDDLVHLVPFCYGTDSNENTEGLILENLKVKNYEIYDRTVPMTDDHFKLILDGFGRWHGLSVALKSKKPETFKKLVSRNDRHMWQCFTESTKTHNVYLKFFEEVKNAWKDDPEIEKLNFSLEQIHYIFSKLTYQNSEDQVITHGDSWTNNLMFQIEKNSKKPLKMAFIDWQLSTPASPILDLATFIYTCVDTGKYQDVKDLLKIYYSSLEKSVQRFGCDVNEIFPFEKLMEHWRKFSCYGLVLGNFLLRFSLTEGNEPPDFVKTIESGKEVSEFFNFTIANAKIYHQRGKNNFLHYLKNL